MWAETTKCMGATQGQKQARDNTEESKPPATARISNLNRKQAHVKFTDPYSGGVSSGRATAPDAQSASQNAESRAHAAANGAGPSQFLNRPAQAPSAPLLSLPPSALPPTARPAVPTLFPPTPYTVLTRTGHTTTSLHISINIRFTLE